MKTLYIMRHAKSSWEDFSISDFDRPLNKRGDRDAPFMGEILHKKGVLPDMILSSPASRAKRTALTIAQQIGYEESKIDFRESIYESSLNNLLMMVTSLDENIETCMLVGHNPSLTALINVLSDFRLDNLPTAGIAAITFESAWQDIKAHSGKILFFDFPKKYQ